jgi:hypothetical protein
MATIPVRVEAIFLPTFLATETVVVSVTAIDWELFAPDRNDPTTPAYPR